VRRRPVELPHGSPEAQLSKHKASQNIYDFQIKIQILFSVAELMLDYNKIKIKLADRN